MLLWKLLAMVFGVPFFVTGANELLGLGVPESVQVVTAMALQGLGFWTLRNDRTA